MKIALLSNANNVHTIRWANGLASRGLEVHLISAHKTTHYLDGRIKLHILPITAPFGYIFSAPALKKILKKIHPDIINAHYATGYGLLARLSGFKPLLLSVWGSDVYDFPEKSVLHREFLKKNIKAATAIASTSHCMARKTAETHEHDHVFITPFGVDESAFSKKINTVKKNNGAVVVGTVKTLTSTYGVDTLIESFAKLINVLNGEVSVHLEITGGGPDKEHLEQLAKRLGVYDKVIFHGLVAHEKVPDQLNKLDIYVALSRMESFGVAILEAAACEKPVIVSDAPGSAEVTLNEKMGFVVPKDDPVAACEAILKLVRDVELRKKMGVAARDHVLKNYTWEMSIDIMIETYRKTISFEKNKLRF